MCWTSLLTNVSHLLTTMKETFHPSPCLPLPLSHHISSHSDVGSDLDLLLSQDINSAIEKFASSSSSDGALGGCMKEEFPPENIHPWDVDITTGIV